MSLSELPDGSRIAVDANILLYHFTGRSGQCTEFLQRARKGSIEAYLPAHIGLEFLHRLMMLEAVSAGITTSGSPAKKMSGKPESVRKLQRCFRDFEALDRLGLKMLDTSSKALKRVTWFSMNYGLLANDAAILATMEQTGLFDLASSDKQLRNISPFRNWCPDDIYTAAHK